MTQRVLGLHKVLPLSFCAVLVIDRRPSNVCFHAVQRIRRLRLHRPDFVVLIVQPFERQLCHLHWDEDAVRTIADCSVSQYRTDRKSTTPNRDQPGLTHIRQVNVTVWQVFPVIAKLILHHEEVRTSNVDRVSIVAFAGDLLVFLLGRAARAPNVFQLLREAL